MVALLVRAPAYTCKHMPNDQQRLVFWQRLPEYFPR